MSNDDFRFEDVDDNSNYSLIVSTPNDFKELKYLRVFYNLQRHREHKVEMVYRKADGTVGTEEITLVSYHWLYRFWLWIRRPFDSFGDDIGIKINPTSEICQNRLRIYVF